MHVRKTEKEGAQVDRSVLSQSRHHLCLSKPEEVIIGYKTIYNWCSVDCGEQGSAEMNHNPITY